MKQAVVRKLSGSFDRFMHRHPILTKSILTGTSRNRGHAQARTKRSNISYRFCTVFVQFAFGRVIISQEATIGRKYQI